MHQILWKNHFEKFDKIWLWMKGVMQVHGTRILTNNSKWKFTHNPLLSTHLLLTHYPLVTAHNKFNANNTPNFLQFQMELIFWISALGVRRNLRVQGNVFKIKEKIIKKRHFILKCLLEQRTPNPPKIV